jgi:hypothetical protein
VARQGRDPGEADAEPDPRDEVGGPLRNTAIVEAMLNVAIDDADETRALLFQLLLEATLVVMTPPALPAQRKRLLKPLPKTEFVTLPGDEGPVLPVFTSTATLLEFRPEGAAYLAVPGATLFEMAAAGGADLIAIDPGSETRGVITRHELEALSRHRLPLGDTEVVAESVQVQIGRPAVPPADETIGAVVTALRGQAGVEQAWLCLVKQGASPPEMVVAARFADDVDEADAQEAMRAFVDEASEHDHGVRELLFVRADEALVATLSKGAGRELFRR